MNHFTGYDSDFVLGMKIQLNKLTTLVYFVISRSSLFYH